MKIKSLKIKNFRNLKDVSFFPSEEINVIYGENAQGKTNLIEAVWLFTGAKCFRGAKDSEIKMLGSQNAVLDLTFHSNGVENDERIVIENRRKAFLNSKPLSSPGMLAGNFYAIVFSPSDLSLIKDGPKERRRFIDIAIGQLYPKYINYLKDYTRAVTQRNAILKQSLKENIDLKLLSAFEAEICENGKKIIKYRLRYIELITPILTEIYNGLSGEKEKITINYLNSANEDDFAQYLVNSRKSDALAGITSAGPHRDDIEFLINGLNARKFGSQGQMRSVALSLKLSEAHVIKNITGEFPVALLDDVMSELDPSRQEYILNHIKGWQVLITCCEPDVVNRLKEGKTIKIKNGKIEE